MSDEMSPEATVAGEAAATAVEELHSREAVVDAATLAAMEASDASATAYEAHSEASQAVTYAETATAMASDAQATAQEASEVAAVTAYMTEEAFNAHREETDAMLREMREYIDSRVPLPAPVEETPAFEEVEADGATARTDVRNSDGSDTGDGETGGSSSGGEESNSGEAAGPKARYGLRHKRR